MQKKMLVFIALAVLSLPSGKVTAVFSQTTVREALQTVRWIAYPEHGRPVDATVAFELQQTLAPQAELLPVNPASALPKGSVIRIGIADEPLAGSAAEVSGDRDWLFFRLTASGNGELVTSKPHLLYALFCQVRDNWLQKPVSQFNNGKRLRSNFSWLRGEDGIFATKKRFVRGYDPEGSIKELARMGCSSVVVNALSTPFSLETGPPGEIYYRFYVSAPDLDQFVETEFNKGTYPPEYLEANFNFLKKQAALAIKYGLTPGLYICDPRTVPESLLQRYPYLRGARVDHPFRSFRPRYTLTLGHPLVRWHYAEMLRKIMHEIPEISFIQTFLNDSGSGFEYTSRLYPGRNGGAYVVREWSTQAEFEQAAAKNIIRYYRLLRNVGRKINPEFHIIAGLFAIPEEEPLVLAGMDKGIDLQVSPRVQEKPEKRMQEQALLQRGSRLFSNTSAKGCLVLGIPAPWWTYDKLGALLDNDLDKIIISVDPPSLAPRDVNREVVAGYQLGLVENLEAYLKSIADDWVGAEHAAKLVDIWRDTDTAVRNAPNVPLYGTSWAFEMYRFWVRPYAPDIDKIPESQRRYYENYLMATFNNPHRVDFAADVMWKLISIEQAEQIVQQYDAKLKPNLQNAITKAEQLLTEIPGSDSARAGVAALRDRLLAARCYFRSLRNIGAWIAGVHGYLEAENELEKQTRLKMVREMIEDEMQNAKDLLALWRRTKVQFIPIASQGETWHLYGENLGELIENKISLMRQHKDDLPYIDPDFMWRMPPEHKYLEKKYLRTREMQR